MSFRKLLGVVFLAITLERTFAEDFCQDSAKLHYEIGQSYPYDIDLTTYNGHKPHESSHGAREHHHHHASANRIRTSEIQFRGTVLLTALENCQLVLTLDKVTHGLHISRDDHTKGHVMDVPRQSVKFTFKNGEVSEIQKAQDGTQPWLDNVIRGILTMLQNKALSNQDGEPEEKEVNIRGECISHIRNQRENVYHKSISTHSCSHATLNPSFPGVPYSTPLQPLSHRHHPHEPHLACTTTLANNQIGEINCTDVVELPCIGKTHHMEVHSRIVSSNASVTAPTTSEIDTLVVSMPFTYSLEDNSLGDQFFEKISRVASDLYTAPSSEKAALYLQLKSLLQSVSDFASLESQLSLVSTDDPLQSQFLVNIVREVATELVNTPAIKHLAGLVSKSSLDDTSTMAFFTKLPYALQTSPDALAALKDNVQQALATYQNDSFITFHFTVKKKMRIIMLGVSGYAYKYCQAHDCTGDNTYSELVTTLSTFCTSKQPEIAPSCIQALGNLDYLPTEVVETLKSILTSSKSLLTGDNPKITALDGFRRTPCNPDLLEITRNLLENSENSEDLRITAYLALARCPSSTDPAFIESVLNVDPSSAVSSFIAGHIYNLVDSQSPSKAFFQSSPLASVTIPASVPTAHNTSSNSRYVEYSTFRPDSNWGFSSNGHVIWKDSPLFAHLNLTADWNGRSYNYFEIGASRRYFPKMEKFSKFIGRRWGSGIGESLMIGMFGIDSYYRWQGTTVSMGIDLIGMHGGHQFFDRWEGKDSWRLDLVRPWTLMDTRVIWPTIGGPTQVGMEIAYMPMLKFNHSGNAGLGLMDLFKNWDEKNGDFTHTSESQVGFVGRFREGAGWGTPLWMELQVEVAGNLNHSVAFESVKDGGNWRKMLRFPEETIWSQGAKVGVHFVSGSWGEETTRWPVFGEVHGNRRELFKLEGMGLQVLGVTEREGHLDKDVVFMVKKSEPEFEGYSLEVEHTQRTNNGGETTVKVKTNGLSTEDQITASCNYEFLGVNDIEGDGRPSTVFVFQYDYLQKNSHAAGFKVNYTSLGWPLTEMNMTSSEPEHEVKSISSLASFGVLTRPEYKISIDSWGSGNKIPILDASLTSDKTNCTGNLLFHNSWGKISVDVGLPATDPSNMEGFLEVVHEPRHSPKSSMIRKFTVVNRDIRVNTSIDFRGYKMELEEHIPPKLIENIQEPATYFERVQYTNHFHDAEGKDVTLELLFDQRSAAKSVTNGSLTISGASVPTPFVTSVKYAWDSVHRGDEFETGIVPHQRFDVFVDVFGRKQASLNAEKYNYQKQTSEDEPCEGSLIFSYSGKAVCVTETKATTFKVTDFIEIHSNFSNVGPYELGWQAHHSQTNRGGEFRVIIDKNQAPGTIEKRTAIVLHNIPREGVSWNYDSVTDVYMESRTFNCTHRLRKTPHDKEWTLTGEGSWPETFPEGTTSMKFVHTCPEQRQVEIELKNEAKSEGESVKNSLTADLTVDSKKHQVAWVLNANLPRITEGTQEKQLAARFQSVVTANDVFKIEDDLTISRDTTTSLTWQGQGQTSVMILGKEKLAMAYNHELAFPDSANQDFQISSKTSGWFESESSREPRNNTWTSNYNGQARINDQNIHLADSFNFAFKRLEETGNGLMDFSVDGARDFKCEDISHFNFLENVTIQTGMDSMNHVKDIGLNGTHLHVYAKGSTRRENQTDSENYLVDFDFGVRNMHHQHKFGIKTSSTFKNAEVDHHKHHHGHHHHHHHRPHGRYFGRFIPSNFNFTVSK